MQVMTRGAAKVAKRLFDKGKIDGVLALGVRPQVHYPVFRNPRSAR